MSSELKADQRIGVGSCANVRTRPRSSADSGNHPAHLLMTCREVTPNGFGPRTALEMWGPQPGLRSSLSGRDEYLRVRDRWAQLTNHAVQQAGLAVRVDQRSLAKQVIDREPTPSIPQKVRYAECKPEYPVSAQVPDKPKYPTAGQARGAAKPSAGLEDADPRPRRNRGQDFGL